MDTLKKPEMILTVSNTIGLVAATAYAYYWIVKQKEINSGIAEQLTKLAAQVTQMPRNEKVQELIQLIQTQEKKHQIKSKQINTLTGKVDAVSGELETLKQHLADVVKGLEENEIKIQLTPEKKKKAPQAGRRRPARDERSDEESEEESEEDDYEEPRPARRGGGRNNSNSSQYGDDIPMRKRR